MSETCKHPNGSWHTHDTTAWFRMAYGTPLGLWRLIPHRWMTRECPDWRAQIEAAQ